MYTGENSVPALGPRTSRRLYSCTYRPSHAHRDRATYLNHPIRKYWCSGSKRVQATLRAEDRTRLLLDFSHTTRLISASAPLRTWLRANTLALSKIPAWQIPAWHCHVLEYLELSSCFFICIFIFSPDLPTWRAGFDPRHPSSTPLFSIILLPSRQIKKRNPPIPCPHMILTI